MNTSVILAIVLAALLAIDAATGSAPVAPANDGWHAIGPVPRHRHAMAYDTARSVMVMFGGQQLLWQNPQGALLGDTWEFSGQPGSVWTLRSVASPSPRSGHSMVYDSIRRVTILFGGDTSIDYSSTFSGETWEFDGTSWMPRPVQGPSPRADFAFTFDSTRGVAVLHGGYDGAPDNETWEYDGNAWRLRTNAGPAARSLHAMAFDSARDACVMYGGMTVPGHFTNETWEYDGAAGTWSNHTAAGDWSSILHTLTFDPIRNITLRWGGDPFYGSHAWNGREWTELNVAGGNNLRDRYGHACAYDSARGVVVMFGGYDDNGSVWNDTWELVEATPGNLQAVERNPAPHPGVRQWMFYDSDRRLACLQAADVMWEWDGVARAWTKRPAPGPGWRDGASVVYDSQRQVAVLFGGHKFQIGVQGDTWEWNGRTGVWTLRSMTGPSARSGHDMAFDAARGVTVLFGGSITDETWEWDGVAWTQRQLAGPPPRSGHAMVFDAKRNVTMLHGGTYGTIRYSDTWEFDGTQWRLRSSIGPSPHRTGFTMAYDGVHHKTVVFGGYTQSGPRPYVNEVWTWDGTSWTLRPLMNGPEPRDRAAMAFDGDQGNFVIVGGHGWIGPQRDQWLLRLPSIPSHPADINSDGIVNVDDLLAVINHWGPCPTRPQGCPTDISPSPNGDGLVNVADLLFLISNWS